MEFREFVTLMNLANDSQFIPNEVANGIDTIIPDNSIPVYYVNGSHWKGLNETRLYTGEELMKFLAAQLPQAKPATVATKKTKRGIPQANAPVASLNDQISDEQIREALGVQDEAENPDYDPAIAEVMT